MSNSNNKDMLLTGKAQKMLVLVADQGRARFFIKHLSTLIELEDFIADHRASHDIGSDKLGRNHESTTTGGHAYEPRTELADKQKEHFSHLIVESLKKVKQEQNIHQIILIAAPEFLGALRQKIDEKLHSEIIKEINKDFTKTSLKDLEKYLNSL